MSDIRILPTDAGCWVDGTHGHYAIPTMILKAVALGYPLSAADEGLVRRHLDDRLGERYIDDMDVVAEIADHAEAWLCERAPDGFTFAWLDGEFFMLPVEDDEDDRTCPRCRGGIPNDEQRGAYPGALSRADGSTEICSGCGVEEAMIQAHGGNLRGPEAWPIR